MDSLSMWQLRSDRRCHSGKEATPYERPPSKTEPGIVDKKKFTKAMKELASKAENLPRTPGATNKPE
jgi:hypothetical protein